MSDNVIAALAAVQAEIGGIEKKRGGEGGISYPYRGIDAIAAAAQPLLGKAGVVIVPTEAKIVSVDQLTVNGKPWTDTFVNVRWTVYGPGGVEDCIDAETQGIGRDNSDKGYNKAATQAFKNLLLRLLCIGDPQDDADRPEHQNNFTDARPVENPERDAAVQVFDAIRTLPPVVMDEFRTFIAGRSVSVPTLTADVAWRDQVAAKVVELQLAGDQLTLEVQP